MPIRRAVTRWVLNTIEAPVKRWIDDAQGPALAPGLETQLAAAAEDTRKLEKKVALAMGALAGANTKIAQLEAATELARSQAQQAMQQATRALSTAEAAADGIASLETRPAAPAVCSVEGCDDKVRAKGLCARHYQQSKRAETATDRT